MSLRERGESFSPRARSAFGASRSFAVTRSGETAAFVPGGPGGGALESVVESTVAQLTSQLLRLPSSSTAHAQEHCFPTQWSARAARATICSLLALFLCALGIATYVNVVLPKQGPIDNGGAGRPLVLVSGQPRRALRRVATPPATNAADAATHCAEDGTNVLFKLHRGADLRAHDIGAHCTPAAEFSRLGYVACCQRCAATVGCGGWVYARAGHRCWLKGWSPELLTLDALRDDGELAPRAIARVGTFVAGVRVEGAAAAAAARSEGRVVSTAALALAAASLHPRRVANALPRLRARDDFGALLEREGRHTVALELGSRDGSFAARTLDSWPRCSSYTLIGAWAPTIAGYGRDLAPTRVKSATWAAHAAKVKQRALEDEVEAMETRLVTARTAVAAHTATVHWDHRDPARAAASYANASVDFIYVDAHRDFAGTAADVAAFWPKLRTGGIMAGFAYVDVAEAGDTAHDWAVQPDGSRDERRAVRAAVDAFAASVGATVHQVDCDALPSWYLRKAKGSGGGGGGARASV